MLSKHNVHYTLHHDSWDSVFSFKWTPQCIIDSRDLRCILLMFSQNRIPHFLNVRLHNSFLSRGIYVDSFGKISSPVERPFRRCQVSVCLIPDRQGQYIPVSLEHGGEVKWETAAPEGDVLPFLPASWDLPRILCNIQVQLFFIFEAAFPSSKQLF